MDRQNQQRGLKPLQKSFFRLLGQEGPKPIPPKLVRIYGYPLAAIISQLLFWKGMEKRTDGYIYKTEKEFINELGLSSAQQKLAIQKGRKFGFLKVERKGVPAKRHWQINYNRLLEATIEEAERKNIVLTKGHLKIDKKRPSTTSANNRTITDNTQNTTAKNHRTESIGDVLAAKYRK